MGIRRVIQPSDGAAKPGQGQVQRGNTWRTLDDNPATNLEAFFSWPRMRFKMTLSQMESAMRMIGAASLVAICGMLAGAPARADWVPSFKGNDTGGIIAYSQTALTDIRSLAIDHCARYGKVVKFLAVEPHEGGYISFACRWLPYGTSEPPIRAAY
jgi:hypothetical protein